jgi:hypothetical protein
MLLSSAHDCRHPATTRRRLTPPPGLAAGALACLLACNAGGLPRQVILEGQGDVLPAARGVLQERVEVKAGVGACRWGKAGQARAFRAAGQAWAVPALACL